MTDIEPSSTTMRAWAYTWHARFPTLQRITRPLSPSTGQLLIRIRAAALNPIDHITNGGAHALLFSFKWPRVYGFDFSGEIVAVGDGGSLAVGDSVCGMVHGLPERDSGTFAEYLLIAERMVVRCSRLSPTLGHVEYASLPLVAITATKAFRQCGLDEHASAAPGAGPRVLVTGGAGGVGTLAIQLARKLFHASHVATTASAGAKTELCKRLGADIVVDYRSERFENVLATDDMGLRFDAILDCTGEAAKCIGLLKSGGSLCSITHAPTVDALRTWINERPAAMAMTLGVPTIVNSRIGGGLVNLALGGRSMQRACAKDGGGQFSHLVGAPGGDALAKAVALVEAGEIAPVIDRTFAFDQAAEAIAYHRLGRATGKVVVVVSGEAL